VDDRVLVTYATSTRATARLPRGSSRCFGQAGLDVEVLPASASAPTGLQGRRIGQRGLHWQWRKQAAAFLKTNEKALAERRCGCSRAGHGQGRPG